MHGLRATNAMLSERVQAAVKRATDTSEAYKVIDWSVLPVDWSWLSPLLCHHYFITSSYPLNLSPSLHLSLHRSFTFLPLPSLAHPVLVRILSHLSHLFLPHIPPSFTIPPLLLIIFPPVHHPFLYFCLTFPLLPPLRVTPFHCNLTDRPTFQLC